MRSLSEDRLWLTLFYARLFGQNLTKKQLRQRLLREKNGQILPRSLFEQKIRTFTDQGLLLQDKKEKLFWQPNLEQKEGERETYLKKLHLAKKAAESIKKVPFIKGIGITGSIAGENCQENDDLDFLIITKKNRVYWGRFFCYLLAMIKQKKRQRSQQKDAWCFNLFLDEDNLEIPLSKRNLYGASQLKLLKPLWEKDHSLGKLKEKNLWVNEWFNDQLEEKQWAKQQKAEINKNNRNVMTIIGDFGENVMRKMQQKYMSMKITNELVGEKQIFFHPLKRKIENQAELKKLWQEELAKWKVENNGRFSIFLKKRILSEINQERAFLTGSFDLLHQEHLFFIREAIKKTEKLFIGIEGDKRVKETKGNKRPIYNENERRIRLQNLFPETIVFILPDNFASEKTRAQLLQKLKIKKMFVASNDEKILTKKKELNTLKIGLETITARKKLSMSKILRESDLETAVVFKFDREQLKLGNWKE